MNKSTQVEKAKERLGELHLNLLNDPNSLVMVGNMRRLFSELKEMLLFVADNPDDGIGKSP